MKKVIFNRFGSIDEFQIIESEIPTAEENQILVKVRAVSLNPLDWKIRKGEMKLMSGSKFPKNVGIDFSGIVEKTGNSVQNFKVGDEVFGAVDGMKGGALAEYVAISQKKLWHKPAEISFSQAASIPVVGAAAYTAVEKIGKITKNTNFLINGATGGFGMFAIQLAKQKEARVVAVTGTEGVGFAEKWGADEVFDYRKRNISETNERFDAVLELSGKMNFDSAKKIMKPKSVFINPSPTLLQIITSFIHNLFSGQKNKPLISNPDEESMKHLIKSIEKGAVIEISKTFPLEQLKDAYRLAEKGGYVGKITIEINS